MSLTRRPLLNVRLAKTKQNYMWVIQGDWILQVSKSVGIMLDGVDIRIYWDANKDPDLLSFEDENTAKIEFDKIVQEIAKCEKIVNVSCP